MKGENQLLLHGLVSGTDFIELVQIGNKNIGKLEEPVWNLRTSAGFKTVVRPYFLESSPALMSASMGTSVCIRQ